MGAGPIKVQLDLHTSRRSTTDLELFEIPNHVVRRRIRPDILSSTFAYLQSDLTLEWSLFVQARQFIDWITSHEIQHTRPRYSHKKPIITSSSTREIMVLDYIVRYIRYLRSSKCWFGASVRCYACRETQRNTKDRLCCYYVCGIIYDWMRYCSWGGVSQQRRLHENTRLAEPLMKEICTLV